MLVLEQLAQCAYKEHQLLLCEFGLADDQPLALDLLLVSECSTSCET